MNRLPKIVPAIALAALALAGFFTPAIAHHSYAMFDMQKTLELNAEVVRFKWQNPHAFIDVKIATGAGEERWSIEMTSPNNLIQEGWKRTSLKPGDKVKLYVHPLRNGARGGSYVGVRLTDGTTLGDVS